MKKLYTLDIGAIEEDTNNVLENYRQMNVASTSFDSAVEKATKHMKQNEFIQSCYPTSTIDY